MFIDVGFIWLVVSNRFYFHPYLGGGFPIWLIFQMGLVQPPTRWMIVDWFDFRWCWFHVRLTFVSMMPTYLFFQKNLRQGDGPDGAQAMVARVPWRKKTSFHPGYVGLYIDLEIYDVEPKVMEVDGSDDFLILGSMFMFRGVYIGIRLYCPVMLGLFHKTMTFGIPINQPRMTHGSCHVRFFERCSRTTPPVTKKNRASLWVSNFRSGPGLSGWWRLKPLKFQTLNSFFSWIFGETTIFFCKYLESSNLKTTITVRKKYIYIYIVWIHYTSIYLEPKWPLFWRIWPTKGRPAPQNRGQLSSRYVIFFFCRIRIETGL